MPYKIVQTIERGKTKLVVVPSSWEENGYLWWPPKEMLSKLLKNEQSKPDKIEWRVRDCILKRHDIGSYEVAEAALAIMEESLDTDVNDTSMLAPRTTVVHNQKALKFELKENQMRCDQEKTTQCQENIVQIDSSETLNFHQILTNQKIISEKLDNMLQIQAIALENQQKIVQKLAAQSVQLEEINIQLAEIKASPSGTLFKDANAVDTESLTLKPIENQKDLISLDQLLADKAEKKKLQRHLSFLCSASKGKGQTCAYKLLDILFTRDFLCNCSWAGGSRGDMSKIALKEYKNVLNFFHGMIQTWDPTYTIQDNETFFKIITKNSKQRKLMKNLRMSSKRRRKNKDNLEKPQKNGKETEGESMQIQEYAPNDESEEKTARGSIQKCVQKQEKEEKHNPFNLI